MIGYLFLGVLLLAAVHFALRWLVRADPALLARALRVAGLVLFGAFVLYLLLSGRAALLSMLAMFGIPIALMWRRRLATRPVYGEQAPRAGGKSNLATAWFDVTLDHDSGAMEGKVKRGRFSGHALSSLSVEQLVELLAECDEDVDSAAVIEAYLDRLYGAGWRHAKAGTEGPEGDTAGNGGMTREEAYAVLGLKPGASEREVRAAYLRLMKKLHPDRGGSDYLAARLNEARNLLLDA
ncbi:MAG: J domain-containing protein [Dongiaceae bacterium]